MTRLRHVMNGFPLPNWVKASWFIALAALQIAALYYGLRMSDEKTLHKIDMVAIRDSIRTQELSDKVDRRTRQINTELYIISKRTGYIARKVD